MIKFSYFFIIISDSYLYLAKRFLVNDQKSLIESLTEIQFVYIKFFTQPDTTKLNLFLDLSFTKNLYAFL